MKPVLLEGTRKAMESLLLYKYHLRPTKMCTHLNNVKQSGAGPPQEKDPAFSPLPHMVRKPSHEINILLFLSFFHTCTRTWCPFYWTHLLTAIRACHSESCSKSQMTYQTQTWTQTNIGAISCTWTLPPLWCYWCQEFHRVSRSYAHTTIQFDSWFYYWCDVSSLWGRHWPVCHLDGNPNHNNLEWTGQLRTHISTRVVKKISTQIHTENDLGRGSCTYVHARTSALLSTNRKRQWHSQ